MNSVQKHFSYCSWGSQGKNTEVVCHSLLQWTTFCQTFPPWPVHLVVLEKTLESPLDCKEIQPVHPKGNQSWVFIGRTNVDWNSNTLATWCEELTHLKRAWWWERLKVGGEGDDRGWDSWMASPTRWTWVWVSSGSWWWTGRPGMLQLMGSQSQTRLSDWTELNCAEAMVVSVLNLVLSLPGLEWLWIVWEWGGGVCEPVSGWAPSTTLSWRATSLSSAATTLQFLVPLPPELLWLVSCLSSSGADTDFLLDQILTRAPLKFSNLTLTLDFCVCLFLVQF